MKRRGPLNCIVTWDDACNRQVDGLHWNGTIESAMKIAEAAPLYKGRQTAGFLVYINEEALWLAHDYDEEEDQVGNLTVVPLGWIAEVRTARRVLYKR
jgi:hypothetical protein